MYQTMDQKLTELNRGLRESFTVHSLISQDLLPILSLLFYTVNSNEPLWIKFTKYIFTLSLLWRVLTLQVCNLL